jgi:hypothetical protein
MIGVSDEYGVGKVQNLEGTKLLRSSSKSRTSDSLVAWFVVEQSGGRAHQRKEWGETGAQIPLDEARPEGFYARVQGNIKTSKSSETTTREKSGNQM